MTQHPSLVRKDLLVPVGHLENAPPPRTLEQVLFERRVALLDSKEASYGEAR